MGGAAGVKGVQPNRSLLTFEMLSGLVLGVGLDVADIENCGREILI